MVSLLLGKNIDVSVAELNALLERFHPHTTISHTSHPHLITLDLQEDDAITLAALSGGSVKLYREIPFTGNPQEAISKILLENNQSKYCIHSFSPKHPTESLIQGVRTTLKGHGKSSHFRRLKTIFESAGIPKTYADFLLFEDTTLLKTIWAQDLYHWRHIDRGKPYFDAKKGMLPPKVARSMVNLALRHTPKDKKPLLYDPFCGTGTILMEALELNCQVIGSDLDPDAIAGAKQNLAWFIETRGLKATPKLFTADAQALTPSLFPTQPDLVVFEGQLGPPSPKPRQIDGLVKGLAKLYTGVLKRLANILPPKAILVMALPEFVINDSVKTLQTLIDTCEKYGYSKLDSVSYSRPYAKVRRRIVVLQRH